MEIVVEAIEQITVCILVVEEQGRGRTHRHEQITVCNGQETSPTASRTFPNQENAYQGTACGNHGCGKAVLIVAKR